MQSCLKMQSFTDPVKVLMDTQLNVSGTDCGLHFTFRTSEEDVVVFRKRPNMETFVVAGRGKFKSVANVKILLATTEPFATNICIEFSDENGEPVLGDVGACYFMGPEAAPGNPAELCLFYTEGGSIVFALAASTENKPDMVFSLVLDEENSEALSSVIRISWLGYRCGVGKVLSELQDVAMLRLGGAN